WKRNKGKTGIYGSGQGPTVDHTLGTAEGYYVYLDTRTGRRGETGKLSIMITNPSSTTTTKCLSFWFYMRGSYVNKLEIFIREAGGKLTQIWQRVRGLDDQWYHGHVNIMQTGSYQLVFVGYRGSTVSSVIALDDISILEGGCPVDPNTCDFEDKDLCGFIADNSTGRQWLQTKGGDTNNPTAPTADHTYETGKGDVIPLMSKIDNI
ncbi:unnamed protein product, partial [Owenia fusiformis]